MKQSLVILSCFVLVFLSACGGGSPLPPVSDENCTPEQMKKIEDANKRTEFASACLRR